MTYDDLKHYHNDMLNEMSRELHDAFIRSLYIPSTSIDAMDSSRQRDLLDHIDRVIERALQDGTED